MNDLYMERKDTILSALIERNGIQYLADTAARVLNNPLFLYDLSGKILAKSAPEGMEDIWAELLPEGHLVHEHFSEVEKAGVYDRLLSRDEPVWGKFTFCPYRFLGCRIREGSTPIGIATLVEVNPVAEDDKQLMVVICKSILFEMIYYEHTAAGSIPYYNIFNDLLGGAFDRDEITERILALKLHFPDEMRLISFPRSAKSNPLGDYFLRDEILSCVPSGYCIIFREMPILLLDNSYWNDSVRKKLLGRLSNPDSRIAVSNIITEIFDLPTAFEQVNAVHRLCGQNAASAGRCVEYDEVRIFHLYEQAGLHCDLRSFIMPVVNEIDSYDRQHSSLLSQSLETYLECGRNIQHAAKQLHWHKNTLYYRLQKIQSLFGMDLADEQICFSLQTSYRLRRLIFVQKFNQASIF